MRPSFKVVAAAYASSPAMPGLFKRTGITPTMLAGELLTAMNNAPNAQARDAIFSHAMADIGIFTAGVEQFNKGTEHMLAQMDTPDAIEKHALRMSEASKGTPQYVAPDRIKFLHGIAKGSSLQQGLADRFRERDATQAKHEAPTLALNARAQRDGDDDRDRRSALMAAVSQADTTDHLRLDHESPLENSGDARQDRWRGHVGVRESVAAAFEAHQLAEDLRDPLDNEALLSMSDSV